uniref:Uncharacterized protein n=1 Tax=Steinernema glaseri TaxID=37863 RepID=A0A1I7Y6M5_9BILA
MIAGGHMHLRARALTLCEKLRAGNQCGKDDCVVRSSTICLVGGLHRRHYWAMVVNCADTWQLFSELSKFPRKTLLMFVVVSAGCRRPNTLPHLLFTVYTAPSRLPLNGSSMSRLLFYAAPCLEHQKPQRETLPPQKTELKPDGKYPKLIGEPLKCEGSADDAGTCRRTSVETSNKGSRTAVNHAIESHSKEEVSLRTIELCTVGHKAWKP